MELRTGVSWKLENASRVVNRPVPTEQALLRREPGEVLCEYRQRQGRTLHEVSSDARVSLRYLSEVERGQEKASSESLSSICKAINVPLSHVLRFVADRVDFTEGRIPPQTRVLDPVPKLPVRSKLESA